MSQDSRKKRAYLYDDAPVTKNARQKLTKAIRATEVEIEVNRN